MAESLVARQKSQSPMFGQQLMEEVCERSNLQLALKRVRQNGGSPGVDGMSVDDLGQYLKENWLAIKPQWSHQNRPLVVSAKPANGERPRQGCFNLLPPGTASRGRSSECSPPVVGVPPKRFEAFLAYVAARPIDHTAGELILVAGRIDRHQPRDNFADDLLLKSIFELARLCLPND